MVQRIPISKKGYTILRQELDRLQRFERIDVIRAIETAREHGDLSENAEYHAAKERQSHVEGRIRELQDKISRAEIIDCSTVNCERVVFGVIVSLFDLDTNEELTYQLLGPDEADVKNGSISVTSPLGQSIIGKSIGDEVKTQTPGGERIFEIMDIESAPAE
jgi:transcription elongation factor GreA